MIPNDAHLHRHYALHGSKQDEGGGWGPGGGPAYQVVLVAQCCSVGVSSIPQEVHEAKGKKDAPREAVHHGHQQVPRLEDGPLGAGEDGNEHALQQVAAGRMRPNGEQAAEFILTCSRMAECLQSSR